MSSNRRLLRRISRSGVLVVSVAITACGLPGDNTGVLDVDLDLDRLPLDVDGTVLAAGAFVVEVAGSVVTPYRMEASLPQGLSPTSGMMLLFTFRDASQPWLMCEGVATSSNCTVLLTDGAGTLPEILLEGDSREVRFFLEPSFELGAAPAPGCHAFLVGGAALQWALVLSDDLVPGSSVAIRLPLRRTEEPEVVLAWQLILADPSTELPSDQISVGCA